jgi:hypothetical protein
MGMGIAHTDGPSIDPGEIHDILRNDRRRRVIKQLQSQLEPVSLRDLSERIAASEAGESPAPRNVRESVYNSLHQTHLPKLDDMGIIDYDTDRKTVALESGASDVDVYMEVVARYGISWATYYRTIGVAALLVVVAASTDVPLVAAVPTLAWASAFLGLFAISAVYQLWSRRWFYLRQLLG